MWNWAKRGAGVLRSLFETAWNYLGSLAAVCLFAAVLGLGIYHAVVYDGELRCYCYAGVYNPVGAEEPQGILLLSKDAAPGVVHVRMEYDGRGKLQRMKSLDASGYVRALPGSRVAEQRLQYDAAGRLIRRENRDAAGALVDDAQGVAVREFAYDAAGRHVRSLFRNAAGDRVSPRFPGYAECRISYDAEGRLERMLHLDAEGNPAPNARGEELVQYQYGEDGKVRRSNLVGGELAENVHGIATEVREELEHGFCCRWLDAAGNPAVHPQVGAAALLRENKEAVHIERRRLLGTDGEPQATCRACAEHMVRLNSRGLPEWELHGGADGLPVDHRALGYAERVCLYDAAGNLQREYFWDAAGNPAPLCERRHAATAAGNYTLSLHADGSTAVQPENGPLPYGSGEMIFD